MERTNKYKVHLQSEDQRLFEVAVKADGMTDRDGLIVFWRRCGLFGWFRSTVHFVHKDALISVIRQE